MQTQTEEPGISEFEESRPAGQVVTQKVLTTVSTAVEADYAGAGFEGMSMDEQITPFLRILQANSPQANEAMPDYVMGARPGMLFDTATQDSYDALIRQGAAPDIGVETAICFREHGFGVWIPRDLGGGFRGLLPPNDSFVMSQLKAHGNSKFNLPRYKKDTGWTSRGQKTDPTRYHDEDIELTETINYYVLYAPHGTPLDAATARRAIVRFTSTAMQVAQGLNTRMRNWLYRVGNPNAPQGFEMKPAAIWQYRWRLRTIGQSKGDNSWFTYRFDLVPADAKPPFDTKALIAKNDSLFAMGREFYELARAGRVKTDDAAAGTTEDDLPF